MSSQNHSLESSSSVVETYVDETLMSSTSSEIRTADGILSEDESLLVLNLSDEAEEDLANNNDPNNNAAVGNEDSNVVAQPPSEEGNGSGVDISVERDIVLILRLMSGRSYDDVRARIEAHLGNLARVQVVLNEMLEEEEEAGNSQTEQTSEISDTSEGPMEKNKQGNGLFCKNSRTKRSWTPQMQSERNQTGTALNGHGRKRKILDLNLEAHCSVLPETNNTSLDSPKKTKGNEESSPLVRFKDVEELTETASGSLGKPAQSTTTVSVQFTGKLYPTSINVRKEKLKINLSEQDLHGPFNFFAHRPQKEGKAKQQQQLASSSIDKSVFAPLRDDLKKVLQEHEMSKKSSAFIQAVGQAKVDSDRALHQGKDVPPIVHLDHDSKPPIARNSPPVVDISQTDPKESEELLESLVNMFPDAPKRYLLDQVQYIVGKPKAIERFINDLLNDFKPPGYWQETEPHKDRIPSCDDAMEDVENLENTLLADLPIAGPSWRHDEDGHQPRPNEEPTNKSLPSDKPAIDGRAAAPPAPESDEDKANKRLETLLSLFPTVDPEFLHQKAVEFGFHEESEPMLSSWIDRNVDEAYKHFPTREAYERRGKEAELLEKYSGQVTVEEILEMYDDPEAYFNDPTRNVSDLYKKHSLNQLKKEFRYLSVNVILRAYQQNHCLFVPSVKTLQMHAGTQGRRKTRRPDHECPLPANIDLNFLKELRYSRIEGDVKRHKQQVEHARMERVKSAREEGSLVECTCCYNDECFQEDMLPCRGGHMFCKDCVQRASDVAIGEGKTQLMCLGHCDKPFELATLQKALKAVLFSKWLRRIQLAELEKADIEGLEQCPFCPFATIIDTMPEANKVFSCQNPDCGKESCRLCREISHIPLRCDEVEKDAEVRKRTYIENKMSEALIRTCWKCKKPFVKLDGCNKMTCQCGAKMCYLCRQPVTDYTHFYGQGGVASKGRKCALFSNNKEVHQREVATTALEAKSKMDQENPDVKLKHDPTADIKIPKPLKNQQQPANPNNNIVPPGLEGIVPDNPAERQRMINDQRIIENRLREQRHQMQGYQQHAIAHRMDDYMFHLEPPIVVAGGPMDWHNGFVHRMGELLQLREAQRQRQRAIRRREQQALEEFQIHRINAPQNLPPIPVPFQPSGGALLAPPAPGQVPAAIPRVAAAPVPPGHVIRALPPRHPALRMGANLRTMLVPPRLHIQEPRHPYHQRIQRHLNPAPSMQPPHLPPSNTLPRGSFCGEPTRPPPPPAHTTATQSGPSQVLVPPISFPAVHPVPPRGCNGVLPNIRPAYRYSSSAYTKLDTQIPQRQSNALPQPQHGYIREPQRFPTQGDLYASLHHHEQTVRRRFHEQFLTAGNQQNRQGTLHNTEDFTDFHRNHGRGIVGNNPTFKDGQPSQRPHETDRLGPEANNLERPVAILMHAPDPSLAANLRTEMVTCPHTVKVTTSSTVAASAGTSKRHSRMLRSASLESVVSGDKNDKSSKGGPMIKSGSNQDTRLEGLVVTTNPRQRQEGEGLHFQWAEVDDCLMPSSMAESRQRREATEKRQTEVQNERQKVVLEDVLLYPTSREARFLGGAASANPDIDNQNERNFDSPVTEEVLEEATFGEILDIVMGEAVGDAEIDEPPVVSNNEVNETDGLIPDIDDNFFGTHGENS